TGTGAEAGRFPLPRDTGQAGDVRPRPAAHPIQAPGPRLRVWPGRIVREARPRVRVTRGQADRSRPGRPRTGPDRPGLSDSLPRLDARDVRGDTAAGGTIVASPLGIPGRGVPRGDAT